ncbi:16S rRNA (cytidine(1402)-2'-O)-methyltransferase [bacterium]|nr:16S rRNA (cytidine(1402)-2'-O)-methyltransferase [bacterium]
MLFVVATPIGNLKDITLRALEVFKKADLILAEDTRRTKKLLNFYQISKPTESFHQHSSQKKIDKILRLLKQGKQIVLVSDSGTPGISDPGPKLVRKVFQELGENFVSPVPGPSALTAALSVSGLSCSKFVFLGYPPHKKGRKKFFSEIENSKYPLIFFESPHRLIKTLEALCLIKGIQLIVFNELTKMFEKIFQASPCSLLEKFKKNKSLLRGEFTLIVFKK